MTVMHVFFSGIGGTGIGPLALIAKQAGLEVSGSDKQDSQYIGYLSKFGISITIGQDSNNLINLHNNNPIDWYVYSSALPLENPNHPELIAAKKLGIKCTKRDSFLSNFISEKKLKLIAFAGTHGKTTSTAMAIWAFKQLGIPISYSVGAKINFGEMAEYNIDSEYFIYECDEFDHNFLQFNPYVSVLSKVDWDHQDIYPTRESYVYAFKEFCGQTKYVIAHKDEIDYLGLANDNSLTLVQPDPISGIKLAGNHNRHNAAGVATAITKLTNYPTDQILEILETYPGSNRRFEKLATNIYTDYAHTPEEIEATLQLARELSTNIAVIYEPLTNLRQQFIKDKYHSIFNDLNTLYWVPSYLARENPNIPITSPQDFVKDLAESANAKVANLDSALAKSIKNLSSNGVLCVIFSGGGGGSLDEWARKNII